MQSRDDQIVKCVRTWIRAETVNYASRSCDRRSFRFSFVTLMRKRSASFTASAFGNAPATSGSSLITSPKLLRPGPSLRTRSVDKSYSGRSSSSNSSFFISFSFSGGHFSRTNQANDTVSFSIRDDQQTPSRRLAHDKIPMLINRMVRVIKINIKPIIKDRGSFFK